MYRVYGAFRTGADAVSAYDNIYTSEGIIVVIQIVIGDTVLVMETVFQFVKFLLMTILDCRL